MWVKDCRGSQFECLTVTRLTMTIFDGSCVCGVDEQIVALSSVQIIRYMHKILPILFLLGLCSCNTWSDEGKDSWKQACNENAVQWAASKEDAQTYCNCALDKMMQKYPNINDALEHVNELATDTSFVACRHAVKVK